MTSAVKDILQRIDALPEKDRERLQRELDARMEKDWIRLARHARARARAGRVTQTTIDRAVERERYGR